MQTKDCGTQLHHGSHHGYIKPNLLSNYEHTKGNGGGKNVLKLVIR